MRRLVSAAFASGLLVLVTAGSALAAHCVNESKPDGAGQHIIVLINPVTEAPTIVGGKITGGFADVYLDLDQSGTLTAADLLLVNDTFLIGNHSPHFGNPAQGTPAVLPVVLSGADPAGEGRGVGHGD